MEAMQREEIETVKAEGVPEGMDLDQNENHIDAAEPTDGLKAEVPAASTEAHTEVETKDGKPLSKNQKKKLAKQKLFAETREQWRADKRDKRKAAKHRRRELAENVDGLKRKAEEEEEEEERSDVGEEPDSKKQKIGRERRVVEPITLIMDCGFDEMMNDKEIISMSSQLTRCYAVNRAAKRQVNLCVTSLNGRLLARYQNVMKSQHLKWKNVKFSDTDYEVTEENKEKGNLVYLTADSEDTIEDLEAGTSYIIGGIVDRNRYKNLCYNKAKDQGIRTAKLPIGEYIKMSSRFVLTTNQVVEIMLRYLECRDWKAAFMEVIPQRKQPKLKPKKGTEAEEQEGEYEEEPEGEAEGENGLEGDNGIEEQPKPKTPETESSQKPVILDVDGSPDPLGKLETNATNEKAVSADDPGDSS